MPDVPKNAKQPTDHAKKGEAKAAQDEALGRPIKIWWTYAAPTDDDPDATEETSFEIAPEVANDWEIIEMFADLNEAAEDGDDGEATLIAARIMRKLLGRAELKRLKSTITDDSGRVDPEKMMEFFSRANEAMGNPEASSGS